MIERNGRPGAKLQAVSVELHGRTTINRGEVESKEGEKGNKGANAVRGQKSPRALRRAGLMCRF